MGGDADSEAWLAARGRKLALATERVPVIFATGRDLERRQALYQCSPEVLEEVPYAGRFYLDLLALSPKTLDKIVEQVRAYDFGVKPETIAKNLALGRAVDRKNRLAFANFVNDQLDAVFPEEARTFDLAVGTVLIVEGARVQGSVQNAAGNDAVLLLKTILIAAMEKRGQAAEVGFGDGAWTPYDHAAEPLAKPFIRFGERLVCEFTPGGNRPDIRVTLSGLLVAVGEIKGRKDLANLWESWMPQIAGHLRTWTLEAPDAPRLFFGTIITEEMITGRTESGTQHAGLRTLKTTGILSAVYNLSLIASGDPAGTAAFDALADGLARLLTGGISVTGARGSRP